MLAAVPVTAAPREAGMSGMLLAGGLPAPDLFPAAGLGALRRARAEGSAGRNAPATRRRKACTNCGCRSPRIWRPPVAWPPIRASIVITAGTQQALRIAAELCSIPATLPGSRIPGYIAGRGALISALAAPVPVPSDTEGLDVAAGIRLAPQARLVLVAPSHATPLGGELPIGRRLALLDWASRANAWVLEDDCDSEFRWEGRPLPPLASLDQTGRVIYCGTFSKTLAPGLRLGFAVVPAPLVAAFVRLRTLLDRGTDALNQAVLAEFMRQGLLAPHVRRMRTEYARRRAAVLGLGAPCAPGCRPSPRPAACTWSRACPMEWTRLPRCGRAGPRTGGGRRCVPTTPGRRA